MPLNLDGEVEVGVTGRCVVLFRLSPWLQLQSDASKRPRCSSNSTSTLKPLMSINVLRIGKASARRIILLNASYLLR